MPRLRTLRAGTVLHRIHRLIHDPLFFGPTGSAPELRYDDPNGTYKLLYGARTLETAFGETLVRVPTVTDILSTDVLIRARSEIVAARSIRLYPLNDATLSVHGLTLAQVTSDDYAASWKLGAYVHSATAADGILYTSRFNGGECVALFDRAVDGIALGGVARRPLTPELAAAMVSRFGKNYVDP